MPTFVGGELIGSAKLNAATARDWATWAPTYNGITVGSGTVVARYIEIGKLVAVHFTFTFGSGSAVAAPATVSAPVTAAAGYTATLNNVGNATFIDSGTGANNTEGKVRVESTTTLRPLYYIASATNITTGGVATTTPFTWATGDILHFTATYEAA